MATADWRKHLGTWCSARCSARINVSSRIVPSYWGSCEESCVLCIGSSRSTPCPAFTCLVSHGSLACFAPHSAEHPGPTLAGVLIRAALSKAAEPLPLIFGQGPLSLWIYCHPHSSISHQKTTCWSRAVVEYTTSRTQLHIAAGRPLAPHNGCSKRPAWARPDASCFEDSLRVQVVEQTTCGSVPVDSPSCGRACPSKSGLKIDPLANARCSPPSALRRRRTKRWEAHIWADKEQVSHRSAWRAVVASTYYFPCHM